VIREKPARLEPGCVTCGGWVEIAGAAWIPGKVLRKPPEGAVSAHLQGPRYEGRRGVDGVALTIAGRLPLIRFHRIRRRSRKARR
jgi:hypothetical protein